MAAGLTSLGALAFFQGDYARAVGLYEEGLALWRQLDDVPGTAITLGNLGEALDHAGDLVRARVLYAECLALSSDLGDRQGVAFAKSHLARIARQDGDPELAVALFAESVRICLEIGDDQRLAEALEGLAGALVDCDDAATAARLFGAAGALREQTETPLLAVHRPAFERDLEAVRGVLGDERLASLVREGETLPLNAIPALLARSRPHPSDEPALPRSAAVAGRS
jgi:tetratricopeptide (TPR) repeat protein